MLVVSSFEQSASLELAIINLEQNGIEKEKILAVPFDKRREERKLFDTIHRSDGVSLFDISAALATVFFSPWGKLRVYFGMGTNYLGVNWICIWCNSRIYY
ncbi:hypothetical protein [Anaerobacillus sp. CMMVII]|uniref:hypothetical protein n=1 Tax=Anaerobacillus sp. CMMVII TaxID=2755588 RepID=UPI0028E0A016|nr:hypothetical protein [Anaerobacillus sp. CMMVII]